MTGARVAQFGVQARHEELVTGQQDAAVKKPSDRGYGQVHRDERQYAVHVDAGPVEPGVRHVSAGPGDCDRNGRYAEPPQKQRRHDARKLAAGHARAAGESL